MKCRFIVQYLDKNVQQIVWKDKTPLPMDCCPALRKTDWEGRRPPCEATFLFYYLTKPKTTEKEIKSKKIDWAWFILILQDNICAAQKLTWSDEHNDNSSGRSSIEFLERSSFTTSLVSHASGGTQVTPRPLKFSSWHKIISRQQL
jgi:hypothetical protein